VDPADLTGLGDPGHRPSDVAACVVSKPSSWVSSPDVTLCTAIGMGLGGRPAIMIDYFRTGEQTWSKHRQGTTVIQCKEMTKTPCQYGCAARDLNPEPAD
jgi:hypothetical protein